MKNKVKGVVTTVFPDDINTDDIIPAWTLQESTEKKFFAKHAFEKYDSKFIQRCKKTKSNIIIAGDNFGCGSSREQAVYAIQENNVKAVIAESYPDIFYRNSLNNGLILITIPDTSIFSVDDNIEINLKTREIKTDTQTIKFKMPEVEATIFAKGGTVETVQQHLKKIIENQETKQNKSVNNKKPQTIVEKIITDHIGQEAYANDRIEKVPIDLIYFNEVIGPPSIEILEKTFKNIFPNNKVQVFNKNRVSFIPDHTVPSCSITVSEGITQMEEFAEKTGVKCFKEGDGIEHAVYAEKGYVVPGSIILGTDSHTDTNGAFNALAFGVGTTDGSFAMATGHIYNFTVPETIRINFTGNLPEGSYAKDIILHIIGKLGVGGASKKVIEFGGEGCKNISMDGRATIANMCVEMGARTGIFEADSKIKKYVKEKAKFDYKMYKPDKKCNYSEVIEINLDKIKPQIAFPHKPGNVTSVNNIDTYIKESQKSQDPDFAPIKTKKVTDAFIGACTNGRYEDFVEAAKILKGRQIHPKVNLVAIPASKEIYKKLMENGILDIFIYAGANFESSNCGPCFGKHMGVIGRNAQMISSSNRNYIGRMGSKEAKIFLASPATVAASAIKGELTDPREFI